MHEKSRRSPVHHRRQCHEGSVVARPFRAALRGHCRLMLKFTGTSP
jgi:hypothetical protein